MILTLFAPLSGTSAEAVSEQVAAEQAAPEQVVTGEDAAASVTYYVDSAEGKDTNNGKSEGAAWKTLVNVNKLTLKPGDQVRFKKGGTWQGTLKLKGSGTESNRIIVANYGPGNALPLIDAKGEIDAVVLQNMSYVTVEGLAITNPSSNLERWARGIYIVADKPGAYRGITIRNNKLYKIEGYVSQNKRHKSAAIFTDSTDSRARFEQMEITGNRIKDITVRGITGSQTAKNLNHPENFNYDLKVSRNLIQNTGCDAIRVVGWNKALIEYNNIYYVGHNTRNYEASFIAAAFPQQSIDTVWQFNEIAYTKGTNPGEGRDMDSQAFDIDHTNGGTHIFQYNYTHDNEGGFVLFMGSIVKGEEVGDFKEAIIRYNISQNDGNSGQSTLKGDRLFEVHPFGGITFPVKVYNNTFYYDKGTMALQLKGDVAGLAFYNNIFQAPAGSYPVNVGAVYDNNLYSHAPSAADAHAIQADPALVAAGSGREGLDTVDGYKLRPKSPAIGKGIIIPDAWNNVRDFYNNPLPTGTAPDIGAHQAGR
ncbi:hypothetical protein [Paenibacillus elgii]|uniref:hypothetical protein n=1 Tax=Paenibacillus elgii TaxID=189691 RepID=UPI0003002105|nr:hypothetical protein [Paenibacillus elgii]